MALGGDSPLFWDLPDGRTILAKEGFIREHYPDATLNQEDRAARVSKAEQEGLRRAAYASEADPLFFKWQAGERTEEEWRAKRQEVRDRYPYPAE